MVGSPFSNYLLMGHSEMKPSAPYFFKIILSVFIPFLLFIDLVIPLGLDVLSIGTSQLSQSDFEKEWGNKPNGGGVPLKTREELHSVWKAARPMLVRTYAGTRDLACLAKIYEETINIAWHALSLWWFCRIDGRGPNGVLKNLQEHLEALKFIATSGKPFEPNVSHHFAFRGSDDLTYVISAFIAAKLARKMGIRHLVLQTMLNTPRQTWGIQDLAKARASLQMARSLENTDFKIIFQPRAGLDYFSPDIDKAKAQLAAVTALMDDIEPDNPSSPPIIHVVSYSEASQLADPGTVNESIQITRHALKQYRMLRNKGNIDNMRINQDVISRTNELMSDAQEVINAIESNIKDPYSPEGLYKILADGYFPVPHLACCRDEFKKAVQLNTRLLDGSMKVVDKNGERINIRDRLMAMHSGHNRKSQVQ